MSKYRKSSLSPCWASGTANKENINAQNIVSFKNIVAAKKQQAKRQELSPHNLDGYSSIYVNSSKQLDFEQNSLLAPDRMSRRRVQGKQGYISRQKGIEEQWSMSLKLAKNDQEYRDILKSKDKQINSLHSQVKVLQNTIDLLKSQVESLLKENKALEQDGKDEEKGEVDRLSRENAELKKQLKEFQEIVPKLNELQIIQNALIEQNKSMKKREQKAKCSLREAKSLLAYLPASETTRIHQIINGLLA